MKHFSSFFSLSFFSYCYNGGSVSCVADDAQNGKRQSKLLKVIGSNKNFLNP